MNKEEFKKIYSLVSDYCEKCGTELKEIESEMKKTYLENGGFYIVTCKTCPKC